jgi:hypothetical protein
MLAAGAVVVLPFFSERLLQGAASATDDAPGGVVEVDRDDAPS